MAAYGHYHVVTGRVHYNLAQSYKQAYDFRKAYYHFSQNYDIYSEIYGKEHTKAMRCKTEMDSSEYDGVRDDNKTTENVKREV